MLAQPEVQVPQPPQSSPGYWWPPAGSWHRVPQHRVFSLCLTLPTPFISRLAACLSGTSFPSYPFLSLCVLLAVSQVPQGVASPLSHAVEGSTGPAASGARRACRDCAGGSGDWLPPLSHTPLCDSRPQLSFL